MASMRTLLTLAVAGLLGAAIAAPASAGPLDILGEPRRAYLTTNAGEGASIQEGNLKSSCTADGTIVFRIETCYGQNFYVFPKEIVRLGEDNAVVIEGVDPPDSVEIRYWTRIHRDDFGAMWIDRPKGKARSIRTELEPVVDAAGARWVATFDIDDRGILYLAAKVRWSLGPSCAGCPQHATWAFTAQG